ncbi:hypothetical protein NQ176_g10758 [Zarea fungicola]|uniref:Uncharacterized protein n=1 Tax=Zarea fungicola TaxID=93591 RepID=A0ACC1MDQ2_9HYPO|nr:hypothetical protein NQ176_g10758 [Lecanicillium fungicola]
MPPIAAAPPRTRLPSRPESDRPYVYPSMSITPRTTLSPPLSIKPETQEPRLSISHVSHPPSPFSSRYDHARRISYAPLRPPTPPHVTGRPLLPQPSPGRTQQLKISALISTPPPIEPQIEPPQRRPDIPTGGKRKHESVFYQASQPLHNGQRQVDAHYRSDLRRILHEPDQYAYSRADGEIGYVQFNSYH